MTSEGCDMFYSFTEGKSVFCAFDCDLYDFNLKSIVTRVREGTTMIILGGPPDSPGSDARRLNYVKVLAAGTVGWVSKINIEIL